jgi:hypothetical protein
MLFKPSRVQLSPETVLTLDGQPGALVPDLSATLELLNQTSLTTATVLTSHEWPYLLLLT